jgi:hypothetical protein
MWPPQARNLLPQTSQTANTLTELFALPQQVVTVRYDTKRQHDEARTKTSARQSTTGHVEQCGGPGRGTVCRMHRGRLGSSRRMARARKGQIRDGSSRDKGSEGSEGRARRVAQLGQARRLKRLGQVRHAGPNRQGLSHRAGPARFVTRLGTARRGLSLEAGGGETTGSVTRHARVGQGSARRLWRFGANRLGKDCRAHRNGSTRRTGVTRLGLSRDEIRLGLSSLTGLAWLGLS